MISERARTQHADQTVNSRFPIVLKWALPVLAVAYLLTANLAFMEGSPGVGAAAIGLLLAGALICIRGRYRHVLRLAAVLIGGLIVLGVAVGVLSPVPLVLPPILVPATLAWVFGRSLLAYRTPLVQRFASAFHAPDALPDGVAGYTRRVTWCWALLLAGVALANLWMAMNLTPGGLLDVAGRRAPWPVTPEAFAWRSNLGSYLVIGGMFVGEFVVRIIRFPEHQYRNPVDFLKRARARMPEMMEGFRRD
jgi:uncharacterized membrane protein